MKARKILIASIPLLAATAIAGSGFAAWYFDNVTYGASNAVTIQQTAYSEAGTITAGNSYTLVFDQGHYANRSNAAAGIYILEGTVTDPATIESAINAKSSSGTTSVHSDNQCTIKASYSGLDATQVKNLYNADFDSITFTATVTIGSYLTNYLAFQTSSNTQSSGGSSTTTYTYPSAKIGGATCDTITNSSNGLTSLTWSKTIALSAASGSAIPSTSSGNSSGNYDSFFEIDATTTGESAKNSLFAYKSKPGDASSYNALAAALTSADLSSSSSDSNGCVYYPNAISITYTATLNAHH